MLDITRLISRAGRRPTGVDRVELAYLQQLRNRDIPLFALARTTLGFVLLSPDGVTGIVERLEGRAGWGGADALSLLARRKPEPVRRAESDLRRLALDRCRPNGLGRMLARHLPAGTAYLNTGHSNLTDRMLQAVRHDLRGRVSVLLHDTIPLDFPHHQRPEAVGRFRMFLQRARRADLVIYNSRHTRARAADHFAAWGAAPPGIVAHLGVPRPLSVPAELPGGLPPEGPFFVTVGTIEPRKRHDLLLDIWDEMAAAGATVPGLVICGARGWNNAAVFERLDRLPANGPVRELDNLSDGAIAALLGRSCGLLFPSEAEGFGLPPVEAAALGVPVVCNDLPVYREILGDIPVYLTGPDRYSWRKSIQSLTTGRQRVRKAGATCDFLPPAWEDHFKTVLRFT